MIRNFPAFSNFTRLFLKLNRFICCLTNYRFSPIVGMSAR